MLASFAAIFVSTRWYSARRGSLAGNACSTLAIAIAAQPLPRDQNVVVLTYLPSRHHNPSASLNRPLPPATFCVKLNSFCIAESVAGLLSLTPMRANDGIAMFSAST